MKSPLWKLRFFSRYFTRILNVRVFKKSQHFVVWSWCSKFNQLVKNKIKWNEIVQQVLKRKVPISKTASYELRVTSNVSRGVRKFSSRNARIRKVTAMIATRANSRVSWRSMKLTVISRSRHAPCPWSKSSIATFTGKSRRSVAKPVAKIFSSNYRCLAREQSEQY